MADMCPYCGQSTPGQSDVYQLPMPTAGHSGHAGLHLVGRPDTRTWSDAWDEYDRALAGLESKVADLRELERIWSGHNTEQAV